MEQGIRVDAIAQPARALQYLPETEALLKDLVLPTGKVTVQLADEMNRVPNRCYVPTTWGSAVLEYGDWVVVYGIAAYFFAFAPKARAASRLSAASPYQNGMVASAANPRASSRGSAEGSCAR